MAFHTALLSAALVRPLGCAQLSLFLAGWHFLSVKVSVRAQDDSPRYTNVFSDVNRTNTMMSVARKRSRLKIRRRKEAPPPSGRAALPRLIGSRERLRSEVLDGAGANIQLAR